jgi:hypothetical protein
MNRTLNTNITRLKFKNNHVVYENFIKCTIKDYEFNLSYNPTLLSGSQASLYPYSSSVGGDVFYNTTGSKYFGILKDFAQEKIASSYDFEESTGIITAGGSNIGNNGDSEVTKNEAIGFDFVFYGVTYNSVNLSSDGNLQFVTALPSFVNNPTGRRRVRGGNTIESTTDSVTPLPINNFGPTLFPFFTNLNLQTAYRLDAGIYTQTLGTAGDRIFCIEWKGVWSANTTKEVNFQIRLYETINVIEFVYGTIDNVTPRVRGLDYVIGLQRNYNDSVYFNQYTFDNAFNVPSSGLLLKYTPQYITDEFSPYVTTVGLYNDANDLLAVAKMSSPTPISPNTDMTFLVKFDTQWIGKPYFTPSVTPSLTPSVTPSNTPSISITPSITPSISITPSVTPSVTPSISITPSISATPSISITPSVTPSISITPSISVSISVTPSISITPSITPSTSVPLGECYSVQNVETPARDISVSYVARDGSLRCNVVPASSTINICVKAGSGAFINSYVGYGCIGSSPASSFTTYLGSSCNDATNC